MTRIWNIGAAPLLLLAVALVLLLFGVGGRVQAQTSQVLVSNFGQEVLGEYWFSAEDAPEDVVREAEDMAQEFTTGPNDYGYTLDSIELLLFFMRTSALIPR